MSENNSVAGIFSGHGQIKTPTYKEQAYRLIKEAILYQRFQADTIYSQEAICQELGISRTPVREALLELQKENYIRFCRGKGIQIVSLDDQAIHDILEMRIYLEMAGAELAAQRATKSDLDYIRECLEANQRHYSTDNIIQNYRIDHQFHRSVAKAAHNALLYNTLDDVLNHYLRFETLTVYQSQTFAQSIVDEHQALYEAVKKRDPQQARQAAASHLENAYRRTLGNYWTKKP